MDQPPHPSGSGSRSARAAADYLKDMLESLSDLANTADLKTSGEMLRTASRLVEMESLHMDESRLKDAPPM